MCSNDLDRQGLSCRGESKPHPHPASTCSWHVRCSSWPASQAVHGAVSPQRTAPTSHPFNIARKYRPPGVLGISRKVPMHATSPRVMGLRRILHYDAPRGGTLVSLPTLPVFWQPASLGRTFIAIRIIFHLLDAERLIDKNSIRRSW